MNVNGRDETLEVDGDAVLLDVLREQLFLTGTKEGCREGECGACSVLIDGQPIDSCLYPAMAVNGRKVITIEGLADNEQLTKIQQALLDAGGVQCGFCTPGIVIMLSAFLKSNMQPDSEMIRKAISGNICRCTGYAQIETAVLTVLADIAGEPL